MVVFPVTSYPWRAFAVVISGLILLPLAVVGAALSATELLPGWLFVFMLSVALGFMLSVSVALIAVLVYSITRNEITSRDGTIHIKGGAFHERVELAAITKARRVNIATEPGLAPAKRENGLTLPGFQVGWYTLNNGTWAFVLRSARKPAVYIETSKQFAVLLGVRNPERLLAHIQAPDKRD